MRYIEVNNSLKCMSETPQYVYDAFNEFIFSPDTRVLGKLLARALLFEQVKDVPGDIVECGVFKGSGMLTWLKLKQLLLPGACLKKIIGFDYFDTDSLVTGLSGNDQTRMKELFEDRQYSHETVAEQLLIEKIISAGFQKSDYELVKGDISETSQEFALARPGFKISLLYIDIDLGKPTYDILNNLWDRVSAGGLVVFDDYAIHQWSEAEGADKFFNQKKIQIKSLNYCCPTAYVVKELS